MDWLANRGTVRSLVYEALNRLGLTGEPVAEQDGRMGAQDCYHRHVRTTVTLDPDVVAKLRSAARKSGRSFKDVVNDAIRRGLATTAATGRAPFRVTPRSMGAMPQVILIHYPTAHEQE